MKRPMPIVEPGHANNERERQRVHRGRATLAVARKMVAHMLAVELIRSKTRPPERVQESRAFQLTSDLDGGRSLNEPNGEWCVSLAPLSIEGWLSYSGLHDRE